MVRNLALRPEQSCVPRDVTLLRPFLALFDLFYLKIFQFFQKIYLTWTKTGRINMYILAVEVKGGERVSAAERRKQIIELLCRRRKETVQNLASEFGVSGRTIRRDIEELTLSYPIETVCGRYGGGVMIADWYFESRPKLSPKQTALLKRLAKDLDGEDLEEMKKILARFAS